MRPNVPGELRLETARQSLVRIARPQVHTKLPDLEHDHQPDQTGLRSRRRRHEENLEQAGKEEVEGHGRDDQEKPA